MFTVTRVYNDGSVVKRVFATEAEAEAEVRHNQVLRFGCATFLGHDCRWTGYLSDNRCKAIGEELRREGL